MHDFEAHVRAVEEDLEYYRTKRFESRVFFMARRGIVTFHDLLKAGARLAWDEAPPRGPAEGPQELEGRIRALEDGLDDYVRGIALIQSDLVKGVDLVIEDTRKERGDYDEFFRIAKRHHEGTLEERVGRLERDLAQDRRVLLAVTDALIDKGFLDGEALRRRREALGKPSPWNGARIVARAWMDAGFKQRLLSLGREAVRDLGIPPGRLGKLGVLENTDAVHHVVVCTLCSCYPYDLLGDAPWWYKHPSYRTRIVADPRATLAEMFGLEVPPGREVRVYDSTSDVRYMVIPRRPPGTEGASEEELAKLVTPESLIGAGEALPPSSPRAQRGPETVRLSLV
jgi:nitrile hydratase